MGQLYKRGNTWYADYIDRAGQRQRASTRTSDIRVARARLRDLELATTDRATHPTEAVDAALSYFVDVTHAASPAGTVRCYRQKARHLSRLLGGELVDQLGREDLDRYVAARIKEGAHPHSIHKEFVVLRGALRAATARDLFHGSLEIVPKIDANYTPRTSYLTPDQFDRLADCLVPPVSSRATERTLERRLARQRSRVLYCMLIAFASPRRGELEGMRRELHIDLARGVLRVPRGKTVSRPIAIHPLLRPWLEALPPGPGPVVEPWANVGRDLPAACARAGVPRCTPNDLRRTFASWLVQSGESLYVVSRLLGHSSTRMVELVYGQLDDATLARAIDRLPGSCDAGVTHAVPNPGTPGAGGTAVVPALAVDSVEESATSGACVVPRVGIEPTTRGFSVLRELAPKPSVPKKLLRSVR